MAEEKKENNNNNNNNNKKLYVYEKGDTFHSRYRKDYDANGHDCSLLHALIGKNKNGDRIAKGMCICCISFSEFA